MPTATIALPEAGEYAADFGKYIQLIPECDLPAYLDTQLADFNGLLAGLSAEVSLAHHAPYTWSIREVIGHVTDCERVFGYRAMRIARNDATPLPLFDDQGYVRVANFDCWPLADLLAQFDALRRSHILLLRMLEPEAWIRRGVINGEPMSLRAMGYSIAGHAQHHLNILHKRLAGK